MNVTPEIRARLEKVANMPVTAFVCHYLLNGEIHTEACAIERSELEQLENKIG